MFKNHGGATEITLITVSAVPKIVSIMTLIHEFLLRKTMVGQLEKLHRTMVFVKKHKSSLCDVGEPQPLYFEEKSVTQPSFSKRNVLVRKQFLSETEEFDDTFK